MKTKWGWFLTGYVFFYLLVNFSFAIPNEFDGILLQYYCGIHHMAMGGG